MFLQTRFLTCLIAFLLSFPCYFCSHASPHYNDHLGKASSHSSPLTFINAIKTRELENWPWRKFGSKVGGRSLASLKTINVNDYGAKGDGSDATEVYIIHIAVIFLFVIFYGTIYHHLNLKSILLQT